MKLLVIENGLSSASVRLAGEYAEWRDGATLANGETVDLHRGAWVPRGGPLPTAWGDLSDNTVQTYQVIGYMGFAIVPGDYDAVLLSSHFPIRVWGVNNITKELIPKIQRELGGTSCAFDHFVSQHYFDGKPVFRLDGSTDGEVMERWIRRLINSTAAVWDEGTWIIDTDPGMQSKVTDDKYGAAHQWLQMSNISSEIDTTPTQPELDAGRKYTGYLGWYDELPSRYFDTGDWTGAVGWHLRSGTFRNHYPEAVNWVTEPIKAGFAFVIGSVYEPGLVYPDPVDFLRRVYEDRQPVGLAAWEGASSRQELCFVGDPLWSPYDMATTGTIPPEEPPGPVDPPDYDVLIELSLADGRTAKLIIE